MKCRVCSYKHSKEVINLGMQPLANKYPKNIYEIRNEKKYNLKIFFCKKCKCAQIKKIIDRKKMFTDYYYLSSVNLGLVNHFKKLANKLKKAKFVVDIGSNDGILLEPLTKNGIKAIGIDPSINVGNIANKKGLKTIIDFFNKNTVDNILNQYPNPDIIVASSIMTHLEKPLEFAKNVKRLLKSNGTLILEIEYLVNFLKNLEYERFYFDRPFYFSLQSIENIFKTVDMSLVDVEQINVHGESLRCYIKNGKISNKSSICKKIINNESNILNYDFFKKFNLKIHKESLKMRNKIISFKKKNQNVIGYGAPARVATITNFSKINSDLINYIIDDSPLKQNRYSPGTHISIVSKDKLDLNKIDIVIVFAYEYFNEIKKNFKSYKIKFFKPIPFRILK